MWRTRRGAETLALCLVRTQPCAPPSATGAALALPATVSEAMATSATTTTRRDRCEPRRMAGTLAPRPRPSRAGVATWARSGGSGGGGGHVGLGVGGHEDPRDDVGDRREGEDPHHPDDAPDERVEGVAAGGGGGGGPPAAR